MVKDKRRIPAAAVGRVVLVVLGLLIGRSRRQQKEKVS